MIILPFQIFYIIVMSIHLNIIENNYTDTISNAILNVKYILFFSYGVDGMVIVLDIGHL